MYQPEKDPKLPKVNQEPQETFDIINIEEELDETVDQPLSTYLEIIQNLLQKYGDATVVREYCGYNGAFDTKLKVTRLETPEETASRIKKEEAKQKAHIKKQEKRYQKMKELQKEFKE